MQAFLFVVFHQTLFNKKKTEKSIQMQKKKLHRDLTPSLTPCKGEENTNVIDIRLYPFHTRAIQQEYHAKLQHGCKTLQNVPRVKGQHKSTIQVLLQNLVKSAIHTTSM